MRETKPVSMRPRAKPPAPPLRQLLRDCPLQQEERKVRTEAPDTPHQSLRQFPRVKWRLPVSSPLWCREVSHCPTSPSSHPLQSPGGWPSSGQRTAMAAHHRAFGHAVPSFWNSLSPSPQPSDLGSIHISAEELF